MHQQQQPPFIPQKQQLNAHAVHGPSLSQIYYIAIAAVAAEDQAENESEPRFFFRPGKFTAAAMMQDDQWGRFLRLNRRLGKEEARAQCEITS